MQAAEQEQFRVIGIAGTTVVQLQFIDCQGGAQSLVEPVALDPDFLLPGQLRVGFVGIAGGARRDTDQATADWREGLAPRGVERMLAPR
ncbi:hypothetical protein D3C78_1704880 [compost metagenome]